MDQLTAHLERGWDLAQRGDLRGAAASARGALEVGPDSPEVHNLLGFVAALEGDCEEALDAYQHAIMLDETYVEAMLNVAELMVQPLGRYDDALHVCDQVLAITDYDDEALDALLLKFEAWLAKGDTAEATAVLAKLPKGPFESPSHNLLAGRAHYEAGNETAARALLEACAHAEPSNAEAHYYLAMICEEQNDFRGACTAFLHSRQLEVDRGAPPWAPNAESFLMFSRSAIAALPSDLQRFTASAEVYLADMPGPEMIVDGVDPRTMTLVSPAATLPSRQPSSGDLCEDHGEPETVNHEQLTLRIFIYALNILRAAGSLHAVQQTIQEALETELRATLADIREDLGDLGMLDQALLADLPEPPDSCPG